MHFPSLFTSEHIELPFFKTIQGNKRVQKSRRKLKTVFIANQTRWEYFCNRVYQYPHIPVEESEALETAYCWRGKQSLPLAGAFFFTQEFTGQMCVGKLEDYRAVMAYYGRVALCVNWRAGQGWSCRMTSTALALGTTTRHTVMLNSLFICFAWCWG